MGKSEAVANLSAARDTRRSARVNSETITIGITFLLSIVLVLLSRFISPALGSWGQVNTILTLASFLIVLAFGQGLVILVGGLDLSVSAVVTLGGVMVATWSESFGSEWLSIALVMLLCAAIGALNAVGVMWMRVPPFIMTMASGIIVASATLGYTKGTPRGTTPEALVTLMKSTFLGVPLILIFMVLFVLAGWTLQGWTSLGRRLYAIGTNRQAARIAGVNVWRPIVLAYALSGLCAGLAGMMLVGYSSGATLRMGDFYLLPSIAAVVIGGSSILGGSGSFIGTVGGAILLTTLGTVISSLGIEQGWRTVIEGGIIITALLLLSGHAAVFLKGKAMR